MALQERVGILKPGNVFRDWLVDRFGSRIQNDRCKVYVYKIRASHTVCRYEFENEDCAAVSKFYSEPRGGNKNYNAKRAMDREFDRLRKIERIIDTPHPIAKNKEFNCALVTEYVRGKSLNKYIKREERLYDRLASVANLLRRLHDNTMTEYHKDEEFARFHKVLNQMGLFEHAREKYNFLLGEWWYSSRLDRKRGCMIHNDAHPANYLFQSERVYALDFESAWEHAHPVHDLGIIAAELKHYFARHKSNDQRAEPYIGHLLWHYSHSENEFYEIAQALPFFMSLGLLRMARWKGECEERNYVIKAANDCLKAIK